MRMYNPLLSILSLRAFIVVLPRGLASQACSLQTLAVVSVVVPSRELVIVSPKVFGEGGAAGSLTCKCMVQHRQ